MNLRLKSILVAALCGCVGISLLWLMTRRPTPDYLERWDTPLTYAEATERAFEFPLPTSSMRIYQATYVDWQISHRFVRFEAPADDCIRHIDEVMKNRPYEKVAISHADPRGGDAVLGPTLWFDIHNIQRGLEITEKVSHPGELQAYIWIDLDRGIFYFNENH